MDGTSRGEVKTYRLSNADWVTGVSLAALAFVIGVAGVLVALLNPDGSFYRPIAAALLWCILWSGFGWYGVWLVAAYRRERVYLSDDFIRVDTCCCGSRTVYLNQVTCLVWKRADLRVVIHAPDGEVQISLERFDVREKIELFEFFRTHFDNRPQKGWERVEPYYRLWTQPAEPFDVRLRRRVQRWVCWMPPVSAILLVAAALNLRSDDATGFATCLILGIIGTPIPVWAAIRYRDLRCALAGVASLALALAGVWLIGIACRTVR